MSHVPRKHVLKDLCHCHTKRRIDGLGPANPSCGMTANIGLQSAAFTDYVVKSVSYQKKDWRDPANPSFGMTTTKTFEDAFLRHVTHCIDIV